MKREALIALSMATLLVSVSTGLAGCADESAPNRRGIERAPLTGNSGLNNAYNRENEAPKRDLPSGGGKEFPGQSMAPTSGDTPILLLADLGTDAAITPEAATTTAPTTEPALAPRSMPGEMPPVHGTHVPATGPTTAGVASENLAVVSTTSAPAKVKPQRINDDGAVATPGKTMAVAGTGLSIPPGWGNPVVLENYPHRAWATSTVHYVDGATYSNPYYFRDLLDHGNQASGTYMGTPEQVAKDWIEFPWFYAECGILPFAAIISPPLAQIATRNNAVDAIYLGKISSTGPEAPSPTPGYIHFVYPATTMPSDVP